MRTFHVTIIKLSFIRLVRCFLSKSLICTIFNPSTIKWISAQGYMVLIILINLLTSLSGLIPIVIKDFSVKVVLTFRFEKSPSLFLFNIPDVTVTTVITLAIQY